MGLDRQISFRRFGLPHPDRINAGCMVNDITISTKVKTKLVDNPRLSGCAIDVETFEGK